MQKRSYLTGLTLFEILASSLILALVVSSLANIFVAAKRQVMHSRSRTTAAEAAKWYLESLQSQVSEGVRAPTPNSSCLWSGLASNCVNTSWRDPASAITFQPKPTSGWVISDISGTLLRKVKLTLEWNERTQ